MPLQAARTATTLLNRQPPVERRLLRHPADLPRQANLALVALTIPTEIEDDVSSPIAATSPPATRRSGEVDPRQRGLAPIAFASFRASAAGRSPRPSRERYCRWREGRGHPRTGGLSKCRAGRGAVPAGEGHPVLPLGFVWMVSRTRLRRCAAPGPARLRSATDFAASPDRAARRRRQRRPRRGRLDARRRALRLSELLRQASAVGRRPGVGAILLFGVPRSRTSRLRAYATRASSRWRSALEAHPELVVITTSALRVHVAGHCGFVREGEVDDDVTVELLAKTAISHAEAGPTRSAPAT